MRILPKGHYTIPVNPMKARARIPAATREMGNTFHCLGDISEFKLFPQSCQKD
jgi:hypothetical protein